MFCIKSFFLHFDPLVFLRDFGCGLNLVSQARPFSAQGLSLSVGARAEGSGESGALFCELG